MLQNKLWRRDIQLSDLISSQFGFKRTTVCLAADAGWSRSLAELRRLQPQLTEPETRSVWRWKSAAARRRKLSVMDVLGASWVTLQWRDDNLQGQVTRSHGDSVNAPTTQLQPNSPFFLPAQAHTIEASRTSCCTRLSAAIWSTLCFHPCHRLIDKNSCNRCNESLNSLGRVCQCYSHCTVNVGQLRDVADTFQPVCGHLGDKPTRQQLISCLSSYIFRVIRYRHIHFGTSVV